MLHWVLQSKRHRNLEDVDKPERYQSTWVSQIWNQNFYIWSIEFLTVNFYVTTAILKKPENRVNNVCFIVLVFLKQK